MHHWQKDMKRGKCGTDKQLTQCVIYDHVLMQNHFFEKIKTKIKTSHYPSHFICGHRFVQGTKQSKMNHKE